MQKGTAAFNIVCVILKHELNFDEYILSLVTNALCMDAKCNKIAAELPKKCIIMVIGQSDRLLHLSKQLISWDFPHIS